MFKHLFPVLLFPLILLGAGCADSAEVDTNTNTQEDTQAEAQMITDGSYSLDTSESVVNWQAEKVTGEHYGTVQVSEGALIVQDGKVVGGTVVADMTTIVVEDVENAEMNAMLTEHLKSDDFFSVEGNPTATFAIAEGVNLEGIEGATHRFSGEMTIKDIGKEISFPVTMEQNGSELRVAGEAELDRTEWDIRFRSGKYFENLGDTLIKDDFTLEFDLVFTMGGEGEETADAESEGMDTEGSENDAELDVDVEADAAGGTRLNDAEGGSNADVGVDADADAEMINK